MSTIYSDAAGNKYLGDCRWGNHDINYPTTNWLKSIALNATVTDWWSDHATLMPLMGYTNFYLQDSWAYSRTALPVFTIQFPGISSSVGWYGNQLPFQKSSRLSWQLISGGRNEYDSLSTMPNGDTSPSDYAVCASSDSFIGAIWTYNTTYSLTSCVMFCMMKLRDLNTNFGYYQSPDVRGVLLGNVIGSGTTMPTVINANNASAFAHWITSRKYTLLTGRATYSISCSDGQTPGAQWATDMWVYDNNATLGYPVIGRVPNMLLGVGSYTYLKPVKIQGSVFPDNGSPWYLPVGTFSGKTLLMRCYSSMT